MSETPSAAKIIADFQVNPTVDTTQLKHVVNRIMSTFATERAKVKTDFVFDKASFQANIKGLIAEIPATLKINAASVREQMARLKEQAGMLGYLTKSGDRFKASSTIDKTGKIMLGQYNDLEAKLKNIEAAEKGIEDIVSATNRQLERRVRLFENIVDKEKKSAAYAATPKAQKRQADQEILVDEEDNKRTKRLDTIINMREKYAARHKLAQLNYNMRQGTAFKSPDEDTITKMYDRMMSDVIKENAAREADSKYSDAQMQNIVRQRLDSALQRSFKAKVLGASAGHTLRTYAVEQAEKLGMSLASAQNLLNAQFKQLIAENKDNLATGKVTIVDLAKQTVGIMRESGKKLSQSKTLFPQSQMVSALTAVRNRPAGSGSLANAKNEFQQYYDEATKSLGLVFEKAIEYAKKRMQEATRQINMQSAAYQKERTATARTAASFISARQRSVLQAASGRDIPIDNLNSPEIRKIMKEYNQHYANQRKQGKSVADSSSYAAKQLDVYTKQLRAAKDIERVSTDIDKRHKSLFKTMTSSLLVAAKWYLMYRGMSVLFATLRNSFRSLVAEGIEFYKLQEQQTLGLRGIIDANYELVDAQGNLVKGAEKYNMINSMAKNTWKEMQKIGFSVVGTTADLLEIYNSILPRVSRMGGSLKDAQEITKGAVLAANAMGLSYSTARTSIVSILNGNVRMSNAFTAALGYTEKQVKELIKGGKLLNDMQRRFASFTAMQSESTDLLGAKTETLKELVGMAGANVFEPFINGAKKAITYLQDLMGTVNEGKFELNPEFEQTLNSVRTTLAELIPEMGDFGKSFLQAALETVPRLTRSIVDFLKTIGPLVKMIGQASLAVTNFSLSNVKGIAIAFTAASAISALHTRYQNLADKVGASNASLKLSFTNLIKSMGSQLAWGAVISAVTIVIIKLTEMYDKMRDIKEMNDALKGGDAATAVGKLKAAFESSPEKGVEYLQNIAKSPSKILQGGRKQSGTTAIFEEYDKALGSSESWKNELERLRALQNINAKEMAAINDRITEATIKNKKPAEADEKRLAYLQNEESVALNAKVLNAKDEIDRAEKFLDMMSGIVKELEVVIKDQKYKSPIATGLGERIKLDYSAGIGVAQSMRDKIKDTEARRLTLNQNRDRRNAAQERSKEVIGDEEEKLKNWVESQREAYEQISVQHDNALAELEEYNQDLRTKLENQEITRESYFDLLKQSYAKEEQLNLKYLADSRAKLKELASQDKDEALRRWAGITASKLPMEDKVNKGTTKKSSALEREEIKQDRDWIDEEYELQYSRETMLNDYKLELLELLKQRSIKTEEEILAQRQKNELDVIAQRIAEQKRAIERMPQEDSKAKELAQQRLEQLQEEYDLRRNMHNEQLLNLRRENAINLEQLSIQEQILKLQGLQADLDFDMSQGYVSATEAARQQMEIDSAQAANKLREINLERQRYREQSQATNDGKLAAIQIEQKIQALNQEYVELLRKQDLYNSKLNKAKTIFDELATGFSSFGGASSLFGGLSTLVSSLKSLGGMTAAAKKNNTSIFGLIGGGFGATANNGTGITGTLKNLFSPKSLNAGGQAQGIMGVLGNVSASAGMVGQIAGAAMQIFSIFKGIFSKAAVKIGNQIKKEVSEISDAYSDGSATMIATIAALEKKRTEAISKLSGKKGGQKQLDEILPTIDNALDDLKKQQKQILEDFNEKLTVLKEPSGARETVSSLMALNKTLKEYIDAGGDAAKATEYWKLSLADIKDKIQDSITEAEKDAIDRAIELNDLYEQRADIIDKYNEQELNAMTKGSVERQLPAILKAGKELADLRKDRDKELETVNRQITVLEARTKAEKEIFGYVSNIADLKKQSADLEIAANAKIIDGLKEQKALLSSGGLYDYVKQYVTAINDAASYVNNAVGATQAATVTNTNTYQINVTVTGSVGEDEASSIGNKIGDAVTSYFKTNQLKGLA